MATGRTISASFLTQKDKNIISLCDKISKKIVENVPKDEKIDFLKEFAKISYTRDGGLGLGSGKLQRDAICTRGRQGKAPFSNRNLRWHPLVIAEHKFDYAKSIERIEIAGEDESQVLVFVIKDKNGKEIKYPSDKVHELPERYVVLPENWIPHVAKLKYWNDTLWTQNSCVIPSLEACEWYDSVETYALLGIIMSCAVYHANFDKTYSEIIDILKNQDVDKEIKLPSTNFPKKESELLDCPMCKTSILKNPSNLPDRERIGTWQPAWRPQKRGEGEDASTQIMHVVPLVENELRHNSKNVRYGHRWCNVAMTDHSLDETLDFMEYIVRIHKRCK